jgi:NTP pyrophosphatase (non-canonical NTP hydrolase)
MMAPSLLLLTQKIKSNMELNILQKKVDDWIKKYGVRYFNELTNMAQLTEEVGEVARIISRVYGEQSPKKNEKINDLGEELADVLFVLICLANQTGVDLEKAFEEKLNKKTKRDKNRHFSNEKLK